MTYQPPKRDPRQFLGMTWEDLNQLQGYKRNLGFAMWQWASPRFSSLGTEQARYFDRYGAAATFARINRVRVWLGLELLQ